MISNLPGYARIPLREGDLVAARVTAVAVWDTVGALGIPSFGANAAAADAYRFADDILADNVENGIHAVSYDELRQSFVPTLWRKRERIKQYWFAGAHADVGGGYPSRESGLSNIALKWMLDELSAMGLAFKPFPADWAMQHDAPYHEPWNEPIFKVLPKGPRAWSGYELVPHQSLELRRKANPPHPAPSGLAA
jgi:glutathione S-transferase